MKPSASAWSVVSAISRRVVLYRRYSRGERGEPCGNPCVSLNASDLNLLKVSFVSRLVRKLWMTFRISLLMPFFARVVNQWEF